MAITIDLSALADGIYTVEDDGIGGNGTSIIRDPLGNIVTTFLHPADALTIIGRVGQSLNVNITDSLTTGNFAVGSLTEPGFRFDEVQIAAVLTSGVVTLTANNAISEWGSDAATDIVAGTLLLDAGSGIGTGGNAIETQVSVLEAESVTGGIDLSNIGNVEIGGFSAELRGLYTGASGNIVFTNQGSITLADDTGIESVHSAGNLSLNAIGAAASISSIVDQDALFAQDNISLSAGQDVAFGTGGGDFDNDVRAGGSITINAGRDFTIDGFADLAADDHGFASGGYVDIAVGRDINISDSFGGDASVGVSGSGGGAVFLTTGNGGTLNLSANSSVALFSGSGGVAAYADRVLIATDSGISSVGTVLLSTASTGRKIDLGTASDGATALGLSDAELDRISAGILVLGDAVSGQTSVVGALTFNAGNVVIASGSDVLVAANVTTANSLSLVAGDNVVQTAASVIASGLVSVQVDAPDADGAGGTTTFGGTIITPISIITGNGDADTLSGTAINDTVFAGAGADFVLLHQGGDDTAAGEDGNDRFYLGGAYSGADTISGGGGDDLLILQGGYAGLLLGATSMDSVESLRLLSADVGSFDYSITMHDGNVAAGAALFVAAGDLEAGESLIFNGSAELDGRFYIVSGAGNDILAGGAKGDQIVAGAGNDGLYGLAGNDKLTGGLGADLLNGGLGRDTFLYGGAIESTGSTFDVLDRFETQDYIDLPTAVTGWTGKVTTGGLSIGTFDSDLAAAVDGLLDPNSAVLFTPDSGDFAGRTFAVIDANGDGLYQAGSDYVFEFTNPLFPVDGSSAYFI